MASRPVFVPSTSGSLLVKTHSIDFTWHAGMSRSQSQKSIRSLHSEAKSGLGLDNILEISSKSEQEIGVNLSAFNLMITTVKRKKEFSLECAFQASKVFENGGPFLDLLDARSIDAKRDPRLQSHGRLVGFRFYGVDWDLTPRTAFYDWLYLNALHKNPELARKVMEFSAFTDIAFNPAKSINCQAYSAALYASLSLRGLLSDELLRDKDLYLKLVSSGDVSNSREDTEQQGRLV